LKIKEKNCKGVCVCEVIYYNHIELIYFDIQNKEIRTYPPDS